MRAIVIPLLVLAVLSVGSVGAAERNPGLLGKVGAALAGAVFETRNPTLIKAMGGLLQGGILDQVEKTRGIPWDVAELEQSLSMVAMSPEGQRQGADIAQIMNHPVMTSLFPIFVNERPIGTPQIGRIGTTLAATAIELGDPRIMEPVGNLLRGDALEICTQDAGEIWDLRTLKQTLSFCGMRPEGEAFREDLIQILNHPRLMAGLFPVFQSN